MKDKIIGWVLFITFCVAMFGIPEVANSGQKVRAIDCSFGVCHIISSEEV